MPSMVNPVAAWALVVIANITINSAVFNGLNKEKECVLLIV
jgi:hypothetical protein